MGLRWLADNIKDYDTENVHTSRLTYDMVHICQMIGMNQITASNYKDWYARWIACRIANQATLFNPDDWPHRPGDYILRLDQVKAYIGLSTNASRLTDFQFKKLLAEAVLTSADFHIRKQEA